MPDSNASVLILTPEGRDSEVAAAVLHAASMAPRVCADLSSLISLLSEADCAIIAEEALLRENRADLATWIHAQPPWSDFPFILLTYRGGAADTRLTDLLGNVTILERPFHPSVLVSAVKSAVRARRRQRQAEAHLSERELLIRELHHRVKNTLATVLALMRTGLGAEGSIEEFKQVFTDRVLSLSRTHSLLVEGGWRTASLRDILKSELEPFDDPSRRRILLHGPGVEVIPELAVPLGMAIHELATNAAKYGSLSVPQGRLKVVWTTELVGPSRHLHLTWSESGGPPVSKPTRKGFGSTLIERVLRGQHGASFASEFNPDGFRFRLSLPLKGSVEEGERQSQPDTRPASTGTNLPRSDLELLSGRMGFRSAGAVELRQRPED